MTTRKALAEPLPCPFCGHVGLDFQEGSTFRWLAYSCSHCGIGCETRVQTMGEGTPAEWRAQAELDAVGYWNQRAALAQPEFTYAELEQRLVNALADNQRLDHEVQQLRGSRPEPEPLPNKTEADKAKGREWVASLRAQRPPTEAENAVRPSLLTEP
jgi:hypothetical protein